MGSVRIIQSKHLAVTLMAVENFNLEGTLEMRREAARDMPGEGDALWVIAGVPVGVKESAYMTIAHMSEGDCDRDHVSALCNDRDHVSAVICLGETFVVKSGRRADTSPSVVTYEGDVAARRILPARVTQQSRVEVST